MLVLVLVLAALALLLANELAALRARPPQTVYRYLPRDLDTYLREEAPATATFRGMFEDDNVRQRRTS